MPLLVLNEKARVEDCSDTAHLELSGEASPPLGERKAQRRLVGGELRVVG